MDHSNKISVKELQDALDNVGGDKPPVFTIADRGTRQPYVIPAKTADKSTIRLLLADHRQELLTVYTDGF